ncbi:MAG: DUF364 domain-containing protein [Bacteroidota bacterium]
MTDPLIFLSGICPYDPGRILATVRGDAYFAVMLSDGKIGVCSTLNGKSGPDPLQISKIDLNQQDHRVFQLAYSNAMLNYSKEYPQSGDIFDLVEFRKDIPTVMIGYFPPLVQKFSKADLPLRIFDLHKINPDILPIEELPESVSNARQVIISSSSLVNQSFTDILSQSKSGSDLFLLGPSTPLNEGFKTTYHIRRLFGMVFEPYEFAVLDRIGQGLGTQSFSTFGEKVSL